jgi:hypothetical protein
MHGNVSRWNFGGVFFRLVEDVKERSVLGINRSDFEHRRILDEADIDVIIEVESARRRRRYELRLQAGF